MIELIVLGIVLSTISLFTFVRGFSLWFDGINEEWAMAIKLLISFLCLLLIGMNIVMWVNILK
jgi:hypothetical protein